MVAASPSPSVLSAAVRRAASAASAACILDSRGAYLFANDAWLAFEMGLGVARDEPLVGAAFVDQLDGDDLRRVWSEVLREVVSGAVPSRTVAAEHNTGTLARLTSTRAEPIASAHGVLGAVLVRSVVRERPISDLYVVSGRPAIVYEGDGGRVTQCPCCRRVRDRLRPETWEMVPRWVAVPPPLAQWVTCDLCAGLHLGLVRDGG